jgi:oxalate decarboxylase/phosphoglucose isomerase-like protein (cupin superfamily)
MTIQEEHSDDAINVAPHMHTVVFEDDKIRVMKVSVKPSDKADMHWHPRNMNYVTASGTLRFEKPDGTSADVELKEGQTTSSPEESSHAVTNIGDTTVETIQVELKS